jgi:hypothetical protein
MAIDFVEPDGIWGWAGGERVEKVRADTLDSGRGVGRGTQQRFVKHRGSCYDTEPLLL